MSAEAKEESDCTPPSVVVGLMSGTSLDGLDIAIVSFSAASNRGGEAEALLMDRVVHFETVPLSAQLAAQLRSLLRPAERRAEDSSTTATLATVCDAHTEWSVFAAAEVLRVLAKCDIDRSRVLCIASHGQTVWHRDGGEKRGAEGPPFGATLQIGDTEVLAHASGLRIVGNFRAADVAVGGSGAPLVPWFDRAVLAPMAIAHGTAAGLMPSSGGSVLLVFQNLGGIGNASYVLHDPTQQAATRLLRACDTGPANVLLNEAVDYAASCERYFSPSTCDAIRAVVEEEGLRCFVENSSAACDVNGKWSSAGVVDEALLGRLRAHPFFTYSSRSTGREAFGAAFVADELGKRLTADATVAADARAIVKAVQDFAATAVDLVSWSVAHGCRRAVDEAAAAGSNVTAVWVMLSGGGASNPNFMSGIMNHLDDARFEQWSLRFLSDSIGRLPVAQGSTFAAVQPRWFDDAKEALAFAALGYQRLRGMPSNEPAATGALRRVSLGQVSDPNPPPTIV